MKRHTKLSRMALVSSNPKQPMKTFFHVGPALALASILYARSVTLWAQEPPRLTTQPQDLALASGETAVLTVEAAGDGPLGYQWRLNGANLAGATNATLTFSNVSFTRGGAYNVVVSNPNGSTASDYAILTVDPDLCFQVLDLRTNGFMTTEVYPTLDIDQGALVASEDTVLVNGAGALGLYDATWLSPLGTASTHSYSLVSDLRSGSIYSLANGTSIFFQGGTADSLLEVDPRSGQLTGKSIHLSTSIGLNSDSGLFSGYGRIVLWTGSRFYHIALPSGQVTDLGSRSSFTHRHFYGWAFWGVAEYYGGAIQVVYVQDATTIARLRVGANRTITPVASFSNLGYTSAIALSPFNSRWYFHHESTSQFASSGDHILGSAKAVYVTQPDYPVLYVNPAPRTNYPNDTVVFESVAGGAPSLQYQWLCNGTNLAGATSRCLVLTNVQPSATGDYSVSAANGMGSVTSPNARLFVVSAPTILTQPVSRSALPGTNTTFSVTVQAAPPVFYQWRFNGTPLAGATNHSLSLSHVTAEQAGAYSVLVSNRYGIATSIEALLTMVVDTGFNFRIQSLGSEATAVDDYAITGSSRSSLAVSSNQVLYTGSQGVGRFAAADLSGGVNLGASMLDALLSDLKTEKIYSLANGTNLVAYVESSTTVSNLVEVDGLLGQATTNRLKLSSPITVSSGSGLFAGYGQVVVYTGSRVYRIALPSGVVVDLGRIASFTHQWSAGWAFYGVAENFGGSTYLVYAQNTTSIVRTRVPDGQTTTLANFVNLGSLSVLSASVPRGRWYFHHSGPSQLAGGTENLGFCSATFSVTANQSVDHFSWEPILSSPSAQLPFGVTLTARTVLNDPVTNFAGPVSVSGVLAGSGQPVVVTPAVLTNFVHGVCSAQLVVPLADISLALRAQDGSGHIGLSGSFNVGAANDLKVLLDSTPPVASLHGLLTYTVVVTNTGPNLSTGVWLTNDLPAGVTLRSATPSQGTVLAASDGVVVVALGDLPGVAAAVLNVVVSADALGQWTNQVVAVRNEPETFSANNTATLLTPVTLARVSVDDRSVVKPRSGSTNASFPISLSVTSELPIRVAWATTNGTATTTGNDYAGRSGTVTFAPGMLATNCNVPVIGNASYLPGKFFSVLLTSISNAVPDKAQAICTIVDTNLPPSLTIMDATGPEGNSGSNLLQMLLQLSKKPAVPVTVRYTTVDGTGRAGADYQAKAGILTFAAGTTNLALGVATFGNTVPASDKTFYVQLSDVQNATLERTQAVATIVNDDGIGVVDHFAWTGFAPTQVLNQPFATTVTARDFLEGVITNFNSSVSLSCIGGASQEIATIGAVGGPTYYFPFLTAYRDCRSEVLYLATELKGPHRIGALALNITALPGIAVNRFTIRMKHTSLTSFPSSPGWDNSGWTLVYQRNENLTTLGWVTFTFSTPFDYNGTDNLLVDFSYNNSVSASPYGYVTGTNVPALRGYYGYCNDCNDPLQFNNQSSDNPYSYCDTIIPVLRLTYTAADLPIAPTVSGAFTNGVWAGNLRVQVAGDGLRLGATDASQHLGYSDCFQVLPADDLAVYVQTAANPAPIGQNLTYTVVVSNAGPTSSSSVLLGDTPPPNAPFVTVSLSRGSLIQSEAKLFGTIGTLASGETATLTVVVRPTSAISLTNVAWASRQEAEVYLGNNHLTNVVAARAQGLHVTGTSLTDGSGGFTNALFQVWLSAFAYQTVRVDFSTRDGTAVAGRDYVATNGTLFFPPGTTNLCVPVAILGSALNKANLTFTLNLSNAVNAPITTAQATATLLNDDPLPMISVADVSVLEGDQGYTPLVFNLALSAPSGRQVEVRGLTADATAFAGTDYLATNTLLAFPPGVTNLTVTVLARADQVPQNDKFFWLNLTNPSNATLATAQARGLILNDDGAVAGFDHFVWSAVNSPQLLNRPFQASLVANDAQDNLVTNFNGSAALRGLQPSGLVSDTIYSGFRASASSPGDYTLGFAFTPSSDLIVTHLRTIAGTKVSLWTTDGTLLATVENPNPAGTWSELPLASPVKLSAGAHYCVAYYTGGGTNYYYQGNDTRVVFDDGTIDSGYYTSGDGLPNTTISISAWGADLRYLGPGPSQPAAVSPPVLTFTNGVWAGSIVVLEPVTNLFLVADDGLGRVATTPAFDLLAADLMFTPSFSSVPSSIYTPFTWRITVTNLGPTAVNEPLVTSQPPATDMTLLSATSSQGSCLVSNGLVRCSLGLLPQGSSATLSLTLRPSRGGALTNLAFVTADAGDPNPSNNTALFVTQVRNDDDHDGLPDDWELSHDFDPGNPADALQDLDGDGMSNLDEYRAGADPKDPASLLRLEVRMEPAYLMLIFTTVSDRTYQIERSSTPAGGPWLPVGDLIGGDGDVKAILDFPAADGPARFYRLRVSF